MNRLSPGAAGSPFSVARPSQKHIAERLGISVASVSLALRRKGTVSRELVEKVNHVANEIGYHPNPILSSLASKRFRSVDSNQGTPIAILDFRVKGVGNSEYCEQIRAFGQELGYQVTRYDLDELNQYNNPSATLYARGVQGLIIVGLVENNRIVQNLEWDRFSVVQCGRFSVPMPFNIARPDIFGAVKESFLRVQKFGYRRIGLAPGHHDPMVEDDESRISAAHGMINMHLPKKDQIPPFVGSIDDNAGFLKWVKRWKPDAIIGFNHWFYHALKDAGYSVPRDLGYASLHVTADFHEDVIDGKHFHLSGINQNLRDIARECVVILDQSIHYHSLGIPRVATQVLIKPSWFEGQSLRQQG